MITTQRLSSSLHNMKRESSKRSMVTTYIDRMKRLEFGAEPVIKDAVLRSDFQLSDWSLSAHVTRFFIFPFREGSDPSKPDIVGFSWKLGEKSFVPMITVVATDAGLTNPTLKIVPCKSS